ncbi:MAG TPA: ABC transporter permease subunit [Anaerolineales bacterium]|nr:ABC transporter permease subunit [Anaerolineales bacterium]
MDKVIALVGKEWSEVFRNKFVLFTVIFIPLLMTAIPLVMLRAITAGDGGDAFGLTEAVGQVAVLCEGLAAGECGQFIVISQFMPLFLMMPTIIPITIASYSIVGEKTTRTLEPLLATPITTAELLAGKGLAAAIPAVAATWIGFGIFVAGGLAMGLSRDLAARFFDPLWLTAIFVVGPLLALAGVSIAVMISSRTSDPRVAEQISGLFVLPIVGLIVAQTTGLIYLNRSLILWIALVMVVLDLALLYFATRLFQREHILTRWK